MQCPCCQTEVDADTDDWSADDYEDTNCDECGAPIRITPDGVVERDPEDT